MEPGPTPGNAGARGPLLRVTNLVLPGYLLAAVLFTWPLAANFTSAIPSSRVAFDPPMQAFLLGWDWHALLTHPLAVFNAPIFHPEPNTLTYMDHLLGETFLSLPVLAIGRSIPAAYNFLVLFSFVVSAWAVYRLARLCGASRSGSWLAGFLYAFSPYRFANIDLLNQLQTEFLPLGILFAAKLLRKYRARDLAALAGCLAVQVYFGWYYAYYLAIAIGLLLAYAIATRSFAPSRVPLWKTGAIASAAFLLILPVALPYIQEHRLLPEFRRSLGESALYSADVMDYLKLNRNAVLAGFVPFATGAQSYWPGLVTVVLGLAWLLGGRKGSDLREWSWFEGYFLALAGTAFVLSLGPILHVAGARIWIPLPHAVLYYVAPGFSSMRAPARFACVVLLGLAVLAALGYDRLRKMIRPGLVRGLTLSALFALSIAFAWPRPLSTLELPSESRTPPVYAWLKARAGSEPILELPVPRVDADENETQALRQFRVLQHGHPRLDGTSGFVSRRYREFRTRIQRFPDEDAVGAASILGARLIIVHYADYPETERDLLRSRIQGERRLVPLAEFGSDAVLEVEPEDVTPRAARPSPKTSSARSPETR